MSLIIIFRRAHVHTLLPPRFFNPSYAPAYSGYSIILLTLGAHARSEGYCSCPVCLCVCVCVCVSVRSFLPPRASRPRNIGTYVFTATRKKTFIIVIFAKNASFRSYGVICLPRMPLTTPEPQNTDTNGTHATWARHYCSRF